MYKRIDRRRALGLAAAVRFAAEGSQDVGSRNLGVLGLSSLQGALETLNPKH